jgi:catecholate siderophore receptor
MHTSNSQRRATGPAPAFLALSCVGLFAAVPATGQTAAAPDEAHAVELQGMTVTDTAIDEAVKVDRLESPKFTRPILDLPQTVTVIGAATIRQQNLLTLRDALSTIPGITFGAGEGGAGYGDNINLRGFSATNDITVDGVRSSAFYSRNETFNIEQIEIFNGSNSVFNGAGSVGGTINIAQKVPKATDSTVLSGGGGTDNYYRGTIDANRRLSDLVAVRLNAVYHHNDIPGRDVETSRRYGIASAVTIGIDSPTSLTLAYQYLRDEGYPQYGVPFFPQYGGKPEGVRYEGYYGLRNVDEQNSTQHQASMIFSHAFSDAVQFRNLSRFEDVGQYTVTSQPAGTFCLADGLTPTGAACTATVRATSPAGQTLTIPAGFYLPTGGRGTGRRIRNQTIYDQADLSAKFDTFGLGHTLVFGGSALWEKYDQTSGNVLRTASGYDPYAAPFVATSATNLTGVNPLYDRGSSLGFYYPIASLGDPSAAITGPAAATGLARTYGDNRYTGPVNFTRSAHASGEQTSYAAYLFDTIALTKWLELNGGARYERVSGDSTTQSYSITPGTTFGQATTRTTSDNADSLFSYRVGLVAKPTADTSLYGSIATSKTPSKANVNGSCTADAPGVTGSNCNVAPESATNYEIGAKADVFGKRLQLSVALFRNERDKYRIASGDPAIPEQVLDGKSRVDGIAIGASGNITRNWTVFGNYTYLDSELVRSVSQRCIATPGAAGCTNTADLRDPGAGSELQQTPKHSGSLFTTYQLPFGLQIGYGATYQGSFPVNVLSATNRVIYRADDYLTHRLFAAYTLPNGLALQVNVQNLTDEKYYTTVRNSLTNSWAQPGAGRQVTGTLSYSF